MGNLSSQTPQANDPFNFEVQSFIQNVSTSSLMVPNKFRSVSLTLWSSTFRTKFSDVCKGNMDTSSYWMTPLQLLATRVQSVSLMADIGRVLGTTPNIPPVTAPHRTCDSWLTAAPGNG